MRKIVNCTTRPFGLAQSKKKETAWRTPGCRGSAHRVSPNPTNGDVHVEADFLDPNSSDPIYISILDMNGDYVFQQAYQYPLPQSINVSVLSGGTYSLMVHQGQVLGQANLVKH